jgi:hypothetical protein
MQGQVARLASTGHVGTQVAARLSPDRGADKSTMYDAQFGMVYAERCEITHSGVLAMWARTRSTTRKSDVHLGRLGPASRGVRVRAAMVSREDAHGG